MQSNKKQIELIKYDFKTSKITNVNPLTTINEWIIILMCIWISWQYFNFKLGVLPFLALTAAWFISSDYRWAFKGLPLDIVMIIVWGLTFLPYMVTGNFFYGGLDIKYTIITFMLFTFGIFINYYYMYYNNNPAVLGKIVFFTMFFYLISSIQTYIGLKKYPLAARELATGSDPSQGTYSSLGIGGFGFIYSAVFLNIVILYFVLINNRVSKKYKFFAITVCFMITIMLISASYATSLIIGFLGAFLVICVRDKKWFILSMILAVLFFIAFPKEIIGYFLIDIAKLFDSSYVIQSKFLDLAQGFLGNTLGSQTSGRKELYLASLQTFLQNPFFGIYGPFGNAFHAKVGGHSGWLDLMAYYGLFGSLPLFAAIFFNFKKQLKFFSKHPYYRFLLTAQALFVLFGFINPITYIYQVGFILFVVAPAVPFLPQAFVKRNLEKGNRK
ncbi:hypothetical protein RCG24_20910 [Neobacillus sp. OS1-32]|jgi:hypothetical protein|uniref:O-antigen ligase family protein n=1 Tax=Neobacillus paridis TaxID=2803862 RepID=A0ABS1TVX8_9BACI|nr:MULTISPECIES: hypothetical protein [Neobacillus]MBL4954461.1 hypothetical protein [Neobacillus paridis]WML30309.1 hypothetical protein RCG24_20910 [Neobacillus sp. OS1-32]